MLRALQEKTVRRLGSDRAGGVAAGRERPQAAGQRGTLLPAEATLRAQWNPGSFIL